MLKRSSPKLSGIDKAFLIIFIIALTAYVINYFSQARDIAISDMLGVNIRSVLSVQIRSITALLLVVVSILYNIIRLPRINFSYSVLFLISIQFFFCTLTSDIHDNVITYINHYTTMSLWIYIYIFFYAFFSYNEHLDISKAIIISAILFFALFILNYISVSRFNTSWHYIESYFLIATLPFIFSLNSKKAKSILLILTLVACILSAKRTGIVAIVFIMLMSVNVRSFLSSKTWKQFPKFIFVALLIFVMLNFFLGDELNLIFDRFKGMSEDGGSGRDIVYADVWSMIKSSNLTQLIFGHGYNAVQGDSELGFSSHNDFLEITYDFGVWGIMCYMLFILSVSQVRYVKYFTFSQKIALLIFFVFSFFSHLILNTTYIIPLLTFWAYVYPRKGKKLNNIVI